MNQSAQIEYPHYYGDTVRWLFMIAAVGMLLILPAVNDLLNLPAIISVAGILVLAIASGFTNPRQQSVAWINTAIAAVGFLLFETVAVWAYQQHFNTVQAERFILANVGLGLLFLFALYFSVKTLRGIILKDKMV
jgi:hypothetical protein